MRRMVGKDQDVYRVVVVSQVRKVNPAYVQGGTEQYWILTGDTLETEYGPYNTLGAAKGILTRETIDTWNDGALKWGITGGRIERAHTTWETVDLDG